MVTRIYALSHSSMSLNVKDVEKEIIVKVLAWKNNTC